MAKLAANCTCSTCGKQFEKMFYDSGAGAYSRLHDKVDWAEKGGISLCPDCYKEEKHKKEKEQGLLCTMVLDCIAEQRGEKSAYLVFSGDSYSHKDTLKENGCHYTDVYPACGGPFGMLYRLPARWVFCCHEPNEAMETAKKIGMDTDSITLPSNVDAQMWLDARKCREERTKNCEAELAELGDIPAWTDTIKAILGKKRWNGKIYGRGNDKTIYLDGEKIKLSKAEAEELEQIHAARVEWREKYNEIKQKYNK